MRPTLSLLLSWRPGTLAEAGARLRTCAASTDDLGRRVQGCGDSLGVEWTGQAAATAAAAADDAGAHLALLADALVRAASALDLAADGVRQVQTQAHTLLPPRRGPKAAVAEMERANREVMAATSPIRSESFYTVQGQVAGVQAALEEHERGTGHPRVIVEQDGRLLGRITLSEIVRGPLQSCSVGYWVNAADMGHGVATAALGEMVHVAFTELRLHRVQASTLLDNVASQVVLQRNGFKRYGIAPGT